MKSPLKGKYLVQNPLANFFLRCVDRALSLIFFRRRRIVRPNPAKILIANLAHMGDVLMMTSLAAVLKQFYPEARIGVVVGSWSLPIVKGHPLIDFIHTVDHWKLNRSPLPIWKKILHYRSTRRNALREIGEQSYDVAIDSYPFFPNAISLLWKAKIPVRIGYISGGFGPLLSDPVVWETLHRHFIYSYEPLLQKMGIAPMVARAHLRPSLPTSGQSSSLLLRKYALQSKNYIVIHMGTGNPLKQWPLEKWREFVKKLEGIPLVFTGKGRTEREAAEKVSDSLSGCINLVDRLSWEEYLIILKQGSCLVGVDSLAGHAASVLETPSVIIRSGMTHPEEWAPFGKLATVLSHPVPCAPCYRSRGCPSMDCVRKTSVEAVVFEVKKILVQREAL